MNSFLTHHAESIRFSYSGFDRILFNAIIQPLQQPPIVVGYLDKIRKAPPLSPKYFRQISQDYHRWVEDMAQSQGLRIVEPPKGIRREDWVEPFYRRLRSPATIAVILKSRENARVAVSYPTKTGGHRIELYSRFVWQYYFYVQDVDFGRMFLRICPYFPFNARICINGHEWLAQQLRRLGISFRKQANAFLSCSDPQRLQQLSDQMSAKDIAICARRWFSKLVPFFSKEERLHLGNQHRLFVSQVEYCNNLIFHRRAALDRLCERLFDVNRTIGHPEKLTTVFGRRLTKAYRGELKTQIADHHLGNPVIRSVYKSSSVKQYVRDHLLLRTETTSYDTRRDLGTPKSVTALPALRQTLRSINERYLDVQQDVLETYIDRGQLARLREPSVSGSGRRTPGIKLDDPRLLAVMQALVAFSNLCQAQGFRTRDVHEEAAKALNRTPETYTLAQLRYDLGKLRAKGLVEKIPRSQRYRLTPQGYRVCLVFLKLFHRLYAPLTAGALAPVPQDALIPEHQRSTLDVLYCAISDAIDLLARHVGLKPAG
jgi:hypothetical protein